MYYLGVDIGSVTVKAVVLDQGGAKREGWYLRHAGHPLPTVHGILHDVLSRYPECSLAVTGTGGRILGRIFGIKTTNEVVAQAYSVRRLFPQINTVIELGGEDSKLIIMDQGRVTDFAMNSVCAAGTGSFLEQQAERLRLSIEQFSDMAARSLRPSKIAGRCSVFAKSDMIHLQQIATPVEDIVAGLCVAVARNFKGTIAKGRDMRPPVAFQGGVAANKGMVKAFRDVFGLDDLFIPPDYALMGALGAALKDLDEGRVSSFDLSALSDHLAATGYREEGHRPLIQDDDGFHARHGVSAGMASSAMSGASADLSSGKVTAYLGIDIGSISTNLAVIDESGRLLAKQYLMTAGRPIEAVQQGLDAIYLELGDGVAIEGVGTTGSGRYMIADFVGADIVKNEITAQATAAIFIDPSVDTIFEIGGQDSKYISIRDGIIVDFEMNKACAAGTGSFIEEQAEKLDISVKGEFAKLSFAAPNPCRLGERCTVFMENSLMANLQRGANRDNLLAGLAYSIVQNYINRVVAGKHVGEKIFFQGGVAFNKAVVAAFEKYLDREITVPPHHDVTGAIGMALIAKDHMQARADKAEAACVSQFKGFELSRRSYQIDSFECRGCPNVCEINKVKITGEEGNLFYGGRCEKYDVRQGQGTALPDLFAFREERLWDAYHSYHFSQSGPGDGSSVPGRGGNGGNGSRSPRARLGIPYIFYFHDLLPFWTTLLGELNFDVVMSPRTNKQIVNLGVENVLSEACFPVKVAHGHISFLRNAGVDAIFNPSFINLNQEFDEYLRGLACPHTQTIPYVSKVAIRGIEMISPVIDLSRGAKFLEQELMRILKRFGVGRGELQRALGHARTAQESFRGALKDKGSEILDHYGISLQPGGRSAPADEEVPGCQDPLIVIVGRGYNAFDPGVNLQIPKKLAHIGTLAIPMDFLVLRDVPLKDSWPDMYWRSGQRMLKAARIIRNTPRLFPIFIGNFSCGPDSFILKYFREEMGGKPFLHIEIDEHSADAGAITRCEAFLDSITQQMQGSRGSRRRMFSAALPEGAERMTVSRGRSEIGNIRQRVVYIPRMADHTLAVAAAFEACGVPAEVLPESDKESVELGRRYVSGKECYPYLITAGDMLKRIFSDGFRPESAAFFMPSGAGPCRFGQYNISHRLILEKLGLKDVPIFAPMQDMNFYRELGIVGNDFIKRVWKGVISYELLTKCLHETRPYEQSGGDAEMLYGKYSGELYAALKGSNGAVEDVLSRLKRDFMTMPRRKEKKPVIGVVGEIFVRSHRFSNEDLVRKIEALGGQVWLAPLEEWIHYVNAISLRSALIKRDKSAIMNILVKRFYQKQIEHKSAKPFEDFLQTLREPETKEILGKAARYVHDSFEGETVLSIGKAVDLIERGASGIINAMPFGCMPGTIVTAFMKAISSDYGVPCISIPYDGTESSVTELQLEAFMETVLSNFRDADKEAMRR